MIIRAASEQDWPLVYPFFSSIVADGRSLAYLEDPSPEQARPVWME